MDYYFTCFYLQYSGVNMRKTDTKTTAAEMLEASRKMEIDDNVYSQCNMYYIYFYFILFYAKCTFYFKFLPVSGVGYHIDNVVLSRIQSR